MSILCRAIVVAVLCAAASCATPKAALDNTLSGGIVWPGGGQKPRIMYLWSLSRIAGAEHSAAAVAVVGGYENDPEFEALPESPETLVRPHGVFVDDKNRLYVTDPGAHRVCVVDLDKMDSFNITDANGLALLYPIGVAAGPDGSIYVTDSDLKGLFVFNNKGKFKRLIRGPFERPTGLAIDVPRGILYVADTWAHTVYKYSLDGTRTGSVGERGEGEGKLNYPTHIAVDKEGRLYVSDTLNFRVQVFGTDGRFINTFGLQGDSADTFDKIKGIAVDREGHIYVADTAQDMVKIYDQQGRLLLYFGKPGAGYGEFMIPTGLFMDRTDRLFVVDSFNRRVQAFRFLGGD